MPFSLAKALCSALLTRHRYPRIVEQFALHPTLETGTLYASGKRQVFTVRKSLDVDPVGLLGDANDLSLSVYFLILPSPWTVEKWRPP